MPDVSAWWSASSTTGSPSQLRNLEATDEAGFAQLVDGALLVVTGGAGGKLAQDLRQPLMCASSLSPVVSIPTRFRWHRLLWELPLIIGVSAGLLLAWLRGRIFVLDGHIAGYHWDEWLRNAYYIMHSHWNITSSFRKPFHGWLVGFPGDFIGYVDAAVLVSSVAVTLIVLSAGLLARVLGGPAAGGLAAFAVAAVPLVQNAAHWGTGYPMLAALTGTCLALAVAFAMRPHHGTVLALVVAIFLALTIEDRGAVVAAVVLPCMLLGLLRARRWSLLATAVLGIAIAVSLPKEVNKRLGQVAPRVMSMEQKREHQKRVVSRWTRIERDTNLQTACENTEIDEFLEPPFFTTECARAVFRFNTVGTAPGATFFASSWLAAGGLLWVLGGRRRWLVWTVGASGGAAWLLLATATPMPHRYILQFVVPLAVVVPVGLSGLIRQDRWAGWIVTTLGALAVAWSGWQADPYEMDQARSKTRGDWSPDWWATQTALVRQTVPVDEVLLDCSWNRHTTALLPDFVVEGEAPFDPTSAAACQSFMQRTDGPLWLLVDQDTTIPQAGSEPPLDPSTLMRGSENWTLAARKGAFEIWHLAP